MRDRVIIEELIKYLKQFAEHSDNDLLQREFAADLIYKLEKMLLTTYE